jgi:uroporphyrinogen-III decarboxylase
VPSQISRAQFLQFGLEPFQTIFAAFPDAIRLWHNEGRVAHIADLIDEIGCDIYHCGDDIALLMEKSRRVVLMGTLPPLGAMLHGSPTDVTDVTRRLLQTVPDVSRFVLSTAGGMAPGTPMDNVRAMVQAGLEFS